MGEKVFLQVGSRLQPGTAYCLLELVLDDFTMFHPADQYE